MRVENRMVKLAVVIVAFMLVRASAQSRTSKQGRFLADGYTGGAESNADAELTKKILRALVQEDHDNIAYLRGVKITTKDGVVTLSGRVKNVTLKSDWLQWQKMWRERATWWTSSSFRNSQTI